MELWSVFITAIASVAVVILSLLAVLWKGGKFSGSVDHTSQEFFRLRSQFERLEEKVTSQAEQLARTEQDLKNLKELRKEMLDWLDKMQQRMYGA